MAGGAEAAAGIGKLNEDSNFGPSIPAPDGKPDAATQLKVDAYVVLLDLLDDADPFVVAKAVEGLSNADLVVAVEPLAKAAAKQPDLAPTVLKMLAEKPSMRAKAIPHLQKFCKHAEPRVRAAAIAALCEAVVDDPSEELLAAFNDSQSDVRVAAASALFNLLDKRRQESRQNVNVVSGGVSTQMIVNVSPVDIAGSVVSKATEFFSGLAKQAAAKGKPASASPPAAAFPSASTTPPPPTVPPAAAVPPATAALPPPPAAVPLPTAVPPTVPVPPSYVPKAVVEKKPIGAAKFDKSQEKTAVAKPTQEKLGITFDNQATTPPDKNAAKSKEEKVGQDQWLEECYAGRHRQPWTAQMIAPLEKMLRAEAPRERTAAAVALVPLGKAAALPVFLATVRANPELMETAHQILPWLVWEQRLKTFQELRALAASEAARLPLLEVFAEAPDRRAADLLWGVLADAKLAADESNMLQRALLATYLGTSYYNPSQVSKADRRELTEAAKPRTSSGSDRQRLVALTLLAAAAPEEAAEAAMRLAENKQLSDSLRADAFQVQLVVQAKKEATQTALAALKGSDAARKKTALKYLVHGSSQLRVLQNSIFLNGDFDVSGEGRTSGTPIVPKPPAGVKVEDVRPLLANSEPEIAACAGYLLVLLGDSDGMEPLLRYWRQQRASFNDWTSLAYRAIAVADDPEIRPGAGTDILEAQGVRGQRVLLDDPHHERAGDSQIAKTNPRRSRHVAIAVRPNVVCIGRRWFFGRQVPASVDIFDSTKERSINHDFVLETSCLGRVAGGDLAGGRLRPVRRRFCRVGRHARGRPRGNHAPWARRSSSGSPRTCGSTSNCLPRARPWKPPWRSSRNAARPRPRSSRP